MAIENAKVLNVRIKNKYASYDEWVKSGLVLEAGEIAIAHSTVDVTVDNGVAKQPVLLMKVGDGEKTFANLPWLSAKAADVLSVCKDETALTEFVNTVISNAGIASDDAMQTLAGRVTTVENDLNTEKTGLKARVTTAEEAIEALQGLVGESSVEAQINAKIAALNLADTYAAKVHKHEIADVNGLSDSIAAAKKAGDDAAEALSEYKTLNDAAVKVNSDAIAAMKKDATITTFKGIEDVLAGKQAAGDYSVVGHKHEIADVNGLADSIADAKKAGTDAAGVAATNAADIEALKGLVGESSVESQINTKISDLDLPNTYDAKGAAAAAETAAKGHADSLNTAMNTRVEALEAIDHEHDNATELAKIVDGDVAKWNAAEQNAKDYADDLDEAMDVRVKALEEKFTGDDSVAGQIEAAVAAEAKLRDDADKALQTLIEANDAEILALQGLVGETSVESRVNAEKERAMIAEKANADAIKAISDDYLKAADKEALQTQINTIMNNPDAEGAINSINEFTKYVEDHGTIANGFRADIDKNKADIALAETKEDATAKFNELTEHVDSRFADIVTVDEVVIFDGTIDAGEFDTTTNDNWTIEQTYSFNAPYLRTGHTYTVEWDGEVYSDLVCGHTYDYARLGSYDLPFVMTDLGRYDSIGDVRFTVTEPGQHTVRVTTKAVTIKDDVNYPESFYDTLGYYFDSSLNASKEYTDAEIEKLQTQIGEDSVQTQIDNALKVDGKDKYALATDLAATNTEVAKKANDDDLAAIAKTGSTDDLIQGAMTLVFDCGGASV